jgi:multidrug resistance efflux pump
VVTEEGALVRKGDVLARIADLRTFRVQATLSDVHAQRVAVGMPARVRFSETAALDDKSSPLLRANLRAEVRLRGVSVRIYEAERLARLR